jgi:MFS family permease
VHLRRLVLLVSTIVLADTMLYAVVTPLLPHYADDLLLSKASAGLLAAAYPAGTLLGALPGGWLSARAGPQRTVLAGLALMTVSCVAFGFARDIVSLDVARLVQGVGGACTWSGGLAWLVEEAPPERRGAMIGTALGAAIAGALLGPVVGTVAAATSPRAVFSCVVLVGGALAAWAMATPGGRAPTGGGTGALWSALRRPPVAGGMWLVALPALAFGTLGVLVPLRLDHLGASSAVIGASFLVAAAGEAFVSPFVGRVSDRRGRLVPVRAGLALAIATLPLVLVPRTSLGLAATLVVVTMSLGIFWAPAMAMLSEAAERTDLSQGYAFALVNLAWAIGQTAGSGAGGALAKATGDWVPITTVAALCVLTLAAVVTRAPARAVGAAARQS